MNEQLRIVFLSKVFQLLQCIHSMEIIRDQAKGRGILPFFQRLIEPLQRVNVAAPTTYYQRTKEYLICKLAQEMAYESWIHYDKLITKIVWELSTFCACARERQEAFDHAIRQGRRKWHNKLSTTIRTRYGGLFLTCTRKQD